MLDQVLYERRELIRLEAMRGTLFIVPVELAPVIHQATKLSDAELAKWLESWGISPKECNALSRHLLKILEAGPMPLSEIKRTLPGKVRSVEQQAGAYKRISYRGTNVNVVLQALVHQGLVGSEKSPGDWQTTQANRYFLIKQLYPDLELEAIPPAQARIELIKSYIRAFGPVSAEDCAWWTELPKAEVKHALEGLQWQLISIEVEGLQGRMWMLKDDHERFLKFESPKTPAVRLLPYEDPYTKGYRGRAGRLIAPKQERQAYEGGSVKPTIVVDGRIVGLWEADVERGQGPVTLCPFERLSSAVKTKLRQQGEAMARFISPGVEMRYKHVLQKS